MRRWILPLIAWNFLAPGVFAQAPAQPAGEPSQFAKLEGKVVSAASGEPVRKATLRLFPASGQTGQPVAPTSAVSGDDGRFLFKDVQPGSYMLFAERSGFVRQSYGAADAMSPGIPIPLAAGDHKTDITFKLMPQSVIAGTVTDEEGEPVERAMIQVARAGTMGGQPRPVSGSNTDDRGQFRVANLAAGRYTVMAQRQSFGLAAPPSSSKPGQRPTDYVATFYPGVPNIESATPVEVASGQEVSGINFQIRKAPVYYVRGKVANQTGGNLERIQLSLRPRAKPGAAFNPMMMRMGGGGPLKPDGTFELTTQPGSLELIAVQSESRYQTMLGRVPVDVGGDDVNDVILTLLPPAKVSGVIKTDGTPPTPATGVRVMLVPADSGIFFGGQPEQTRDDGSFTLDSVGREHYRLNLMNMPEGTYVRSILMGGQELVDKGLDLTNLGTEATVEVFLSPKAGTVTGVVKDGDKPVSGKTVTLMPTAKEFGVANLIQNGISDQQGVYTIKNVSPGDYLLLAWPEAPMRRLGSIEFAKPYERKAVKVTVKESEAVTAELTLLKASDAVQ